MNGRLQWRIAVCESTLDQTARLVALSLETFMDGNGVAWPSRAAISHRAGCNIRTVDRAIARLQDAGLLAVTKSPGRRANLYAAATPTVSPDNSVVSRQTVSPDDTVNRVPNSVVSRHNSVVSRHPTVSSDDTLSSKEAITRSLSRETLRDATLYREMFATLQAAQAKPSSLAQSQRPEVDL